MNERRAVFRIVDVNLNRFIEALRVIEDAHRLYLDDDDFLKVKELRHIGGEMRSHFNKHIWARDSTNDPGLDPSATTTSEMTRKTIHDVLEANLSRAKEALRSIEEYSKLIHDHEVLVQKAKECRRLLYDVEKTHILCHHRGWLHGFRLYVLTDDSPGTELHRKVKGAISGGADVIQFRRKNASDRDFLEDAREIRKITSEMGIPLIINDRIDIAVAVGADGIHLGQDDIPIEAARSMVGDSMVIGISTHSPDQALEAERRGADYIGVGAVFSARSKGIEAEPLGPGNAGRICSSVDIPSVVIGGIDENNIGMLTEQGIVRVGVMSAIMNSPEPAKSAGHLKKELMKNDNESRCREGNVGSR